MSKTTGRHFSAEAKVKILRLHLVEGKPVSDLCDEHGLNPSVFYQWQRQLFESGTRAFEPQGADRTQDCVCRALSDRRRNQHQDRLEKQIAGLEARLTRKHEVLSELMEEHRR